MTTPKIKSEEEENEEKQKTDQECSPIYDVLLKRLNFSFWGTPCVFRVTIDKKEIENIHELYDFIESITKEREEGNITKLVEGINEANWNMHLATKSRIITTIKNILKQTK